VRVDLKYIQENSHHITIRDFVFHMKKLRDAIHNGDTCFTHLLSHAWSLEQGEDNGGFHCHLLLIFDGSKHYKDSYLADQVGQKWQDSPAPAGDGPAPDDAGRSQGRCGDY
ncbi:MAG: hypothetical protein CMG78_09775, partial [Marinobacter sp.]|nr:hypothetical protein [Marinobacter sp.]